MPQKITPQAVSRTLRREFGIIGRAETARSGYIIQKSGPEKVKIGCWFGTDATDARKARELADAINERTKYTAEASDGTGLVFVTLE